MSQARHDRTAEAEVENGDGIDAGAAELTPLTGDGVSNAASQKATLDDDGSTDAHADVGKADGTKEFKDGTSKRKAAHVALGTTSDDHEQDSDVDSTIGPGDEFQGGEKPASPTSSDAKIEAEADKVEPPTIPTASRKRLHAEINDSASSEGRASAEQRIGHSGRWQEMFLRLKEYRDQCGDCLVPNRYSADPPLGHWVSSQRRQYKALRTGQPGANAMDMDRISKLESIGFEWETTDPRHVPWDVRYKELCEYVKIHGDAQVPMRWKENIQLSNWVSKQRHDYKLRQRGTSGRLTDERYKLLNDIGFIWEAGKGDNREAELPSHLPPHRPNQVDDNRSRESNHSRRSSNSSAGGMRNSPQQSAVAHPPDPSYRQLPPPHPPHDLTSALAHHAYANTGALMQAASMNQTKLQLAGLYPAASVGSNVRVPPGGLFAMSIPGSHGISFIPIMQNYGGPHMGQPPTMPPYHHHMPGPPPPPPHGAPHFHQQPPFPPMIPPGAGAPHAPPQQPPRGAAMFHGNRGAALPRQASVPDEMQQRIASGPPESRGADPPEG